MLMGSHFDPEVQAPVIAHVTGNYVIFNTKLTGVTGQSYSCTKGATFKLTEGVRCA